MATIRLDDVDQNTSDLIADAAKRDGRTKHGFIKKLLEVVAGEEYAKQQQESHDSGDL